MAMIARIGAVNRVRTVGHVMHGRVDSRIAR
jgi:hypothetical protein